MEELAPTGQPTTAEALGRALNAQRRRFVREYIIDMNGTAAAIRAGYSEKNAASLASRMLRDEKVRAYRDALLREAFADIGVTRDTIALELWKLYGRCTAKVPVMEWDSAAHAWVVTGEWSFDAKGALKALGMMAQLLPGQKTAGEQPGFDGYEDTLDDTGERCW